MSTTLASKPTFIQFKNLRFLIMDSPRQENVHFYVKECQKYHVSDLVRVCEPQYNKEDVIEAGINFHVRSLLALFFFLFPSFFFIFRIILSTTATHPPKRSSTPG